MDFGLAARTRWLRATMLALMDEVVHPAEAVFHDRLAELDDRWACDSTPVIGEIHAEARRRGL